MSMISKAEILKQKLYKRLKTQKPSNRQGVSNDPLTAAGVLDVHCDGCRVGHVSESTLRKKHTEATSQRQKNSSTLKHPILYY